MCIPIFDLLPLVLNNGTVDGEMWSQVALMPMVMKLIQLIGGHCMSSFVILSHSVKNVVKGQLWAEVTQVTIWGHMRVLPSMSQVI